MKDTPLNTPPKESVDAIARSTERIEGAASTLAMLEEKADGEARDPVGDGRREMRARELRGGAGRSPKPRITQSSSNLNPTLSRMQCLSI